MKRVMMILLCCLALLCSGCSFDMFSEMDAARASLDANRPVNATKLPELSDDISDVRITVVPRDVDLSSQMYEDFGGKPGQRQYLQIYYGYCVDGVWTDLPSENYPLVSVFNTINMETKKPKIYTGYEAADLEHMVKIGPYLLVRLDKDYKEVADTLGTEAKLLFWEYDSNNPECDGMYGYLKEDRDSVVSGKKVSFNASSNFEACNYLIVEYASIAQDYELWITKEIGEEIWGNMMTYDDIISLLKETE